MTNPNPGMETLTILPTPTPTNIDALQAKAVQALATNAVYLALATPTTAQAGAQVTRLTRQVNALIRIVASTVDDSAPVDT